MTRLRFGIFDFDPSTRELWRAGIPVRVQAQPLQVLSVLVDHAGEVVSRDQLRQAVWGSDTFVDFDRGLNYCIAQIRLALGDSASSPRFVRTIPKLGYQFIAPVSSPAEPATAEPIPLPIRPEQRSVKRYVLVSILAVAVLGIVVFLIARPRPKINIAVARFDNETGSSEMNSFADGLTDVLVAELGTADNRRYAIIGNAAALRLPRDQRDLTAIGASLHAAYVILGQVQRSSNHIRVLAHLIRLPEQTHITVARFECDLADPLQTESELARKIAAQFLSQLGASPRALSH